MRSLKLGVLAAFIVAVALAIAGCGGGDNSDSSSSSSASSTEGGESKTELTGEPYIIGGLTPVSGEGYNFPDWLAGGKAAVRAINENGGINGRPVEYFNCDDKNNPNEATACARELVDKGVIGVGGGASLFADNITTIFKEADIPWVGGYAETEAQWNDENEFPIDAGHFISGAGSALALKEAGIKEVGQGHMEIPQSDPHFGAFETASANMGLDVVGKVPFPVTATDMTPYVQSMIDSGAKGIGLFALPNQIVAFMKTANQLGGEFTYAYNDGSLTPENFTAVGEFKAYTAGGLPPVNAGLEDPEKYPGMVEFQEDVKAEFEAGEKYAGPQYVNYSMLRTWFATKVIAQIANEMEGEITAPALTKALNEAKDIETGVIPPWTPGANDGPANYKRISNPYVYLSEVESDGFGKLITQEPLNIIEEADIK